MTYDQFMLWSNAALEQFLARKGYPHYGMFLIMMKIYLTFFVLQKPMTNMIKTCLSNKGLEIMKLTIKNIQNTIEAYLQRKYNLNRTSGFLHWDHNTMLCHF